MAEGANRTIDEHTTAMLSESGLPPSFKGEAVAAYIHIWNCLPTTASYDSLKTPYELWHKRKPEVGHLRVWGCMPGMWVLTVKHNPDGSVARHKALYVVKGFSQRPGVDYTEC